ncbi:MAG TPA: FecR domain-containing protein [Chitinophagaceae bacterium]
MYKNFENSEDLITDERFLAWYFERNSPLAADWEAKLRTEPQLKTLNNEAEIIMKQLHFNEKDISGEQISEAFKKLKEKIGEGESQKKSPIINMPSRRNRWWLAAASIIVIAIAGAILWGSSLSGKSQLTHTTEFGQIVEQQLPDGTKVTLNANSSVILGDDWGAEKPREVWLKGEAFFNVAKSPKKQQFIVHTSRFDIIVTGTQFNVVDRPGRVNIMLQEGTVILKTEDGQETLMKPGDFVEYKEDQLSKKELTVANITSWKDRKIYFENTPVQEAAKMITDIYGVEIVTGDEVIRSKLLTGVMPNDDLEVLLQAIEATLECKAERSGNKIVLKSN